MNSRLTEDFLACFAELPETIKAQARRAYRSWRENPYHPSLHFKKVHNREPIYSVRVSLGWRVLGLLEGGNDVLVLDRFAHGIRSALGTTFVPNQRVYRSRRPGQIPVKSPHRLHGDAERSAENIR